MFWQIAPITFIPPLPGMHALLLGEQEARTHLTELADDPVLAKRVIPSSIRRGVFHFVQIPTKGVLRDAAVHMAHVITSLTSAPSKYTGIRSTIHDHQKENRFGK